MAANNTNSPPVIDKKQLLFVAQAEMEFKVELFHRLAQTCFGKCIDNNYKESELTMAENSCIDCCVSKYLQITNLTGQMLRTTQGQHAAPN